MAGNYHFSGDFNSNYANPTNSHFSGDFTDPTGAVTGCSNQSCSSPTVNSRELSMQTGGQGYGMALEQPNAGFNRIPDQQSYEEVGVESVDNLGVSKQYNPSMPLPVIKGGKRHRKYKGGSSLNYYGFDGKNGENLSTFAGAGYPPITVGSQNGGKKHRRKTKNIKRKKHTTKRSMKHRYTKHKLSKRNKTKKYKLGLSKRKSSKLFRKIVGGKRRVYKGGYSQFMGDQAYSQGYELGGPITPSMSALANPMPFKPYNHCADPYGPK